MRYALRDHLTFCIASSRVVFLDRRSDRYFCLGRAAEEAFFRMIRQEEPQPADLRELEHLVAGDVLVADGGGAPLAACTMALPIASLFDRAGVGVHPRHCLGLSAAMIATAVGLRLRPLDLLLARLKARKAALAIRQSAPMRQDVAATVEALHAISLIVSAQDRCLARSIATMAYLLDLGYRPDLVFAVMARPFSAHCWVQLDGIVLTDRLDTVRGFTPILVI